MMHSELGRISGKVVLISALDWGMGHVTRISAVIYRLIPKNKVIFAGNTEQIAFISKEFPGIEVEELGGYNVRLDSEKSTYRQLFGQMFSFIKTMRKEKKWLSNYLDKNQVDLVISDNRYGFFNKNVECIIVSHQLTLQIPFFKKIVSKKLHRMIEKFNACWVPDDEDRRLTGGLTEHSLKIPVVYIGGLNRFDFVQATNNIDKKYKFLIVLSGPDPERLNFANRMVQKYLGVSNNVALLGPDMGFFDNYQKLSSAELKELIEKSEVVVTRAGYTSIMELDGLNKKAILHPTKGQYEQEYLAHYIKNDQLKIDWGV